MMNSSSKSTTALHTDFTQRVVVDTTDLSWVASPQSGVLRKMIERDGGEVARATSIVKYETGTHFDEHRHELGEEIFVLEGVFSDQFGDYGAGSYIKNPPGSHHAPFSVNGCVLLVKLRHMQLHDQERVVRNTSTADWYPGLVNGLSVMPLSEFETQHTALVRWAPGTVFKPHRHFGGEEIYVLDGTFEDEHGSYPKGSWVRSPHMSAHAPFSNEGCTIFVKTGHLPIE